MTTSKQTRKGRTPKRKAIPTPKQKPTPTRGVPVMLDRERLLRYPLWVLAQIRDEFGEDALTKGFEGDQVAKLLIYGLKHEDETVTIEDINDWVDLENLTDVMEAVVKAMGGKGKVLTLVPPTAPTAEQPEAPSPAASSA